VTRTVNMSEEADSSTVDLKSGPFSVLYKAVRGNTQVLVNVRNNHKLLGRVKAYDRHMNLYVRRHDV
jgi:small nuclear ribonucleoprotein D2